MDSNKELICFLYAKLSCLFIILSILSSLGFMYKLKRGIMLRLEATIVDNELPALSSGQNNYSLPTVLTS